MTENEIILTVVACLVVGYIAAGIAVLRIAYNLGKPTKKSPPPKDSPIEYWPLKTEEEQAVAWANKKIAEYQIGNTPPSKENCEQHHHLRTLVALAEVNNQLMDSMEYAWTIIANAHGGDWTKASADWNNAALKWQDEHWHAALNKMGHKNTDEQCDSSQYAAL